MATSGTIGQTAIDVATLAEHVGRRCGVQPNALTPESIRLIKNVMFMFLTSLANRGINLWRVQRGLFGMREGQATYVMPAGTLDVLSALYRTPQPLAGAVTSSAGGTVASLSDVSVDSIFTQSAPGGNVKWDFGNTVQVNLVGLLPGATTTLNLVFEESADNVTWTAVRTPGTVSLTDGKWMWFNIEPAKRNRYFRVRETGTGTLSFREVLVCQDWTEIEMYRMSRDEYSGLPQKRFPGEPRQFWFDRQSSAQMIMWPVPDAASAFRLISIYLHMQCQDITQLAGSIDIPQRWYDAFVANCAYSALPDLPDADLTRYGMLKDYADRTMLIAEAEERDATPSKFVPNISGYTE